MKRAVYILIFLCLAVVLCNASAYAEFDDSTVIAVVKSQTDGLMSLFSYDTPFGDLEIEESENLDVTSSGEYSLFSVNYEPQTYKLTLANKGYDEVLEAVEYLNSLDNIDYAAPNYIYRITSVPDDTYYSSQYSLNMVGAPAVWDMNIDCSSVTVAVIDSGVAMSHPDLADNIWINPNEKAKKIIGKDNDKNGYKNDTCGWDFIGNDADPSDENGHGTHVAGIISAATNNSEGVASLARNAKIVPLRVMNANGEGTTDSIYKAIKYVKKMGFDIVNMSLGGEGLDTTVQSAIKSTNAVFVCAAGNEASDNDTTPVYPANVDSSNVISVASTTSGDTLSYFSNYGAKTVDIAAPGSYIYNTYLDNTYQYLSGTSMACPLVAGAAALVKAKYPDMTPAEIIEKLKSSADTVSGLNGKTITGGRLNAYKALLSYEELNATPAPTSTPTPTPTSEPGSTQVPTPTPTEEPEPEIAIDPINDLPVEPLNRIEFTVNENDTVSANLIFEEAVPPEAEDIRLFIVYREKNTGELKAAELKEADEDMTASFDILYDLNEYEITVYVWDNEMKPLMDIQKYENS